MKLVKFSLQFDSMSNKISVSIISKLSENVIKGKGCNRHVTPLVKNSQFCHHGETDGKFLPFSSFIPMRTVRNAKTALHLNFAIKRPILAILVILTVMAEFKWLIKNKKASPTQGDPPSYHASTTISLLFFSKTFKWRKNTN